MSGRLEHNAPAEAALKALQSRFVDTLDDRILDIEDAAVVCRTRPSKGSFATLAAHVHKLAGIAASFGYPAIGDLARSIDVQITHGLAGGSQNGWTKVTLDQVELLLDAMERAYDSATT